MTSVYKYNNSIIIENGAIGISQNCCCNQCGVEVTKDILITLTGNIARAIGPGIEDCSGPNAIPGLITYTTCNNGNYTVGTDLDIEVCGGDNDPNNTTYCGFIEIFYTVNDFDVQITGWNIECGLVASIEII